MSTIIFIFFSGVPNIIRDILSPNPEIGGALFVFPGNGKGCEVVGIIGYASHEKTQFFFVIMPVFLSNHGIKRALRQYRRTEGPTKVLTKTYTARHERKSIESTQTEKKIDTNRHLYVDAN